MTVPEKMEVDDQWPEQGGLSACRVTEALRPFMPAGVALYAEEGFPWIEVQYDDGRIALPRDVVPIGNAIEEAIDQPVLFQALRPNSICFIVEMEPGAFTRKSNDPHLPATDYGVRLDELRQAWQLNH
jgi:hypothetical protein